MKFCRVILLLHVRFDLALRLPESRPIGERAQTLLKMFSLWHEQIHTTVLHTRIIYATSCRYTLDNMISIINLATST